MESRKEKIESLMGLSIASYYPCSGGCISDAYVFKTKDEKSYFLKVGSKSEMYRREEEGLKELAQATRVPKVFYAEDDFIVMEYIVPGQAKRDTFRNFGRDLAKLHKYHGDKFGFNANNFIGSTPQINTRMDSWCEFYWQNRLLYQLNLAEKNNLATKELAEGFAKLEKKIPEILGKQNIASLLHGDLWSGNYIIDINGDAWLIDPAVYYGDREAEFGMITLFGGFNQGFFTGYNEVYPLNEGWEHRNRVYQLYHLMNHLNLFGRSYFGQVMETLKLSLA